MVWTSVDTKIETIKKDDDFWRINMEDKLKKNLSRLYAPGNNRF